MLWQMAAIATSFLLLRSLFFGTGYYFFLIWNLFLAWIPLWCAQYFYNFHKKRPPLLLGLIAFVWLLFLPNAPYLVTDLIYLRFSTSVTIGFDIFMLGTFAFLGFFLGIYSLTLMKKSLAQLLGNKYETLFVILVSLLSGFAIYLGRFIRWNSWDFIVHPLSLFQNIFGVLSHPLEHPEMILTTLLFGLAMIGSSFLFERLVEYRKPVH